MWNNDVALLITKTHIKNKYGVLETSEAYRQVYCKVSSVTHREKSENGLIGLNSAYVLEVFRYDYSGEEYAEYNGKRYTIYDATEWNDKIRLYIRLEKGA